MNLILYAFLSYYLFFRNNSYQQYCNALAMPLFSYVKMHRLERETNTLNYGLDLQQLTKIIELLGTPDDTVIANITSVDVRNSFYFEQFI